MATAIVQPLMTAEEFFDLPEDGLEKDLIYGKVVVRGDTMTMRNRLHGRTTSNLSRLIGQWRTAQKISGEQLDGEVGVRLSREPDLLHGIDFAFLSPEHSNSVPDDSRFVEGPPIMVAEVLSPSEKQSTIQDKVKDFMKAGVRQTWLVDPIFQTVTIFRPGLEPEFFTSSETIEGDPEMPGLRIGVADIFAK